jgi:hypothetical protein
MKSPVLFSAILFFFILNSIAQTPEPTPLIGNKALKEMINMHLSYPEYDLNMGNEGTVQIEFNTDIHGNVTDHNLVKTVSSSIDSNTIEVFKIIIWEPAKYQGTPVPGKGTFKLDYKLSKFKRLSKRRGYDKIDIHNHDIDTSFTIHTKKDLTTQPSAILTNYLSLNEYIYSNLKYPEVALKTGLEGEVKLTFIIEKSGLPSNIFATEHVGGGCTEEAIRLISTTRWQPGLIDNKAVRTKYSIIINFKKPEINDNHIPNQQGSGI